MVEAFIGAISPEQVEYLVPQRLRSQFAAKGGRFLREADPADVERARALGEPGMVGLNALRERLPTPPESRAIDPLLERVAAGETLTAIAAELGVAVSTIGRRLKKIEGR